MTNCLVWCDRLSWLLGRASAWLVLPMVGLTFTVVVLRYGFDLGWIAMQESVVYLHGTVLMLGMAYTLKRDRHVRVDVFYHTFTPRTRAWVDIVGTCLFLLPFCVVLIGVSWGYVAASWAVAESSREAGGLGGVFLLKTLIPAMAATLLLQGLAILFRALGGLLIRGRD